MTLKELRSSRNISQREVARRMGMTQPGVRRIEETGRTLLPTLERYATAINAPFSAVHLASIETRASLLSDN